MINVILGVFFVLAIIYIVPFLIYGLASVMGEIGQTIGPNYTWKEAIAGILSETIYLPLSAYITNWLIAG